MELFDNCIAHYYQDQVDRKSLSTSRQTEEMTFRATYLPQCPFFFFFFKDLDYVLNWNNRSKVKTQTSHADVGVMNASQVIQVGGCC